MDSQLDLLFHAMDGLKPEQLKRFKLYLSHRTMDGIEPIPRDRLGDSDATDIVETMMEVYGCEGAVRITIHILRKLKRTDLAEELKKKMEEGQCLEEQTLDMYVNFIDSS